MDFTLPEDFMDVQESKPVPDGLYDVRITEAEIAESKSSGLQQIIAQCDLPEHPDAAIIYTYLQLPGQDGLKNAEWTSLNMKRFLVAFNIPFEGSVSVEAFPGSIANLKLSLEHDESGKYGDKNVLVLPKLA